jgi:hypothetical protein
VACDTVHRRPLELNDLFAARMFGYTSVPQMNTSTTYAFGDLRAQAESARAALDAWVREVVAWHFDPDAGTPFWLEFARRLEWDPRREIRRVWLVTARPAASS